MPPTILLTHWVHPEVIDYLAGHGEVIPNPTRETWTRDEVRTRAADATALMAFMPDRVDANFLAACPQLKIVAGALKGFDNFDVEACTAAGVWLTNVPDLLTAPTAELALGLAIALMRHVLPGDAHVRGGDFAGWRPELYGRGLDGCTVGILGMGAVGRSLTRRLSGFDVRIIYADPKRLAPERERELRAHHAPLAEVVAHSDVLFPLTPLSSATLHMLDAAALTRVKPGAVLVNVGRGSLVDEGAVAAALGCGRLAGYAADVFEMEDWALPARPRQVHPELLTDPRTLFTPHLGSAVEQVRRDIALEAAANIVAVLEGQRPRDAVNDLPS